VRVYLIRHAAAAPGEHDELRALNEKGRGQARKLGKRFAKDGLRPDAIVSSPLLRARETAEAIARATGVDAETDTRLSPGATSDDLRDVVAGRGNIVVVVAHQPDCSAITAGITGESVDFKTAGVQELEL
jgi:phosphohistidine phosphatase